MGIPESRRGIPDVAKKGARDEHPANNWSGVEIVIRKINLRDRSVTRQLLSLQQASYAVEVRLIGLTDIPPLKDTVKTLRQSGETFYGYFMTEELVGALSYKRTGDVLDICRLMVHPAHFRQGIASELLQRIETAEHSIRKVTVTTSTKNEPAKSLYKRHGFVEIKQEIVASGVPMTFFEKTSGREKDSSL